MFTEMCVDKLHRVSLLCLLRVWAIGTCLCDRGIALSALILRNLESGQFPSAWSRDWLVIWVVGFSFSAFSS